MMLGGLGCPVENCCYGLWGGELRQVFLGGVTVPACHLGRSTWLWLRLEAHRPLPAMPPWVSDPVCSNKFQIICVDVCCRRRDRGLGVTGSQDQVPVLGPSQPGRSSPFWLIHRTWPLALLENSAQRGCHLGSPSQVHIHFASPPVEHLSIHFSEPSN